MMEKNNKTLKLIVSDLHLGDNDPCHEQFCPEQEENFAALLDFFSAGSHARSAIELIINGDCFDFLEVPPFPSGQTVTDPVLGVQKIREVIAAHPIFFRVLQRFIAVADHRVTFMTGNHDVELYFTAVRQQIHAALGYPAHGEICFHDGRAYIPLPDVYIEHGNHFDPWNRIDLQWDPETETVALPTGSLFVLRVFRQLKERFPYLDCFMPRLSHEHNLALVCLFDRRLALELAPRLAGLRGGVQHNSLSDLSRKALPTLPILFNAVLEEARELQNEVFSRWGQVPLVLPAHEGEKSLEAMRDDNDFVLLRRIFTGNVPVLQNALAQIGGNILEQQPAFKYVIFGHTHQPRAEFYKGERAYLNTGTWVKKLAMPTPEMIDGPLASWLANPTGEDPLTDITTFVFVALSGDGQSPTQAGLYTWRDGRYHALIPQLPGPLPLFKRRYITQPLDAPPKR